MSRNLRFKQVNYGRFPEIVLSGCSLFTLSYFSKHTFLLNYYKNYTTLNGNDGPVNPSPQLINMVSTVEQDLKDLASENTPITPYIVPGLRVMHAGTCGTIQGGIIGLPLYFEFNEKGDVDNKIKKEESSFIDEKPLEDLYDCILLGEKAKKYAIAQKILCVNTLEVYIQAVIPIGIAVLIKLTCDSMHTIFNTHSNQHGKAMFFSLFLVLGVAIWRTVHSKTKNYFESHVEETLATLGLEYIEGAIEFYNKAIERRRLKLDFKDQNSNILNTISDKINSINSRREIPISYKLAFYKSKLDAYLKNDNSEEETAHV